MLNHTMSHHAASVAGLASSPSWPAIPLAGVVGAASAACAASARATSAALEAAAAVAAKLDPTLAGPSALAEIRKALALVPQPEQADLGQDLAVAIWVCLPKKKQIENRGAFLRRIEKNHLAASTRTARNNAA